MFNRSRCPPPFQVEAEVLELALNFLKMYSEEPMTTIPKVRAAPYALLPFAY